MKSLAASISFISLLCFFSIFVSNQSEAGDHPQPQAARPTPTAKPESETVSPTPTCSPQPTPSSTVEKNNPLRELTLENFVNIGVGTPDFDCDGICNFNDNCPTIYNPDQKNDDGNEKGNACDFKVIDPLYTDSRCDMDKDGVPDLRDNCPGACNSNQNFVDVNKNGVNDLCDPVIPKAILGIQMCNKPKKVKPLKPKRVSASANR